MNIFWFRRDLRLSDNTALLHALNSGTPTLPIFIFDETIIHQLEQNDPRVSFIYEQLKEINTQLKTYNSNLLILKGTPLTCFKDLFKKFAISKVFFNKDYEPSARKRDASIIELCQENSIEAQSFNDHLIFEPNSILKKDGTPYTVFTPFKKKWLSDFELVQHSKKPKKDAGFVNFYKNEFEFPSIEQLGFIKSSIKVKMYNYADLEHYHEQRDIPNLDATSYLSPHLRFGTVSTRKIVSELNATSIGVQTFISELIWREFFSHILFHFPHVTTGNFRAKYNGIQWRNNENEFQKWCNGTTGYPIVDAGMRQLNATGYMHNRVRMITAGFLCKHLLIDWRWGEAYFANKLLDFELASNNGNWQWAAGTGCDAAPYFRVFNPTTQTKRFDPALSYVKKWVPEFDTLSYPQPMVDHKFARERALKTYKIGIATNS